MDLPLRERPARVVKVRQAAHRRKLVRHAVRRLELLEAQLGRRGITRFVQVRQDGVAQPATTDLQSKDTRKTSSDSQNNPKQHKQSERAGQGRGERGGAREYRQ